MARGTVELATPTLTGCQEVRSPFRSQRGFGRLPVGAQDGGRAANFTVATAATYPDAHQLASAYRICGPDGGKTPRKGLEMATLAETCYVCPNGATPVSICSYGQSRGPRESREKQTQGNILQ